ncbi:hypothetical protein ACGH7X_40725 [Streptomyces sp. BBFR51]|uniref:hypothetical protein n=1 Tax=Streptomyces sp. BBFR51 TaxID=3372856 RepID=UPI0037DCBD20
MSAFFNGTLVGLPSDEVANTVNHAVTGLASGFFAGFIGLLVHLRRSSTERPRPTDTP